MAEEGLRLMAAFNLVPKEWFEKAKTEYLAVFETKITSSNVTTRLKLELTTPLEHALAASVAQSDLIFAFHGRLPRREASDFSGWASQHESRTSINFYNAPLLPVISNNAFRQQAAVGELTWQN
jgi:hypothetical protein